MKSIVVKFPYRPSRASVPALFPAPSDALHTDFRIARADYPQTDPITKLLGRFYHFIDGSGVEDMIQGDGRTPVLQIGEQTPQQCLPRFFADDRFVDISVFSRPFVEIV